MLRSVCCIRKQESVYIAQWLCIFYSLYRSTPVVSFILRAVTWLDQILYHMVQDSASSFIYPIKATEERKFCYRQYFISLACYFIRKHWLQIVFFFYSEMKLVSKTKHDKHMWISMLQAQNPKLVCQPSTTTHSFRQAIEKSHSIEKSLCGSIDSDTCEITDGINNGTTFKIESHHFYNVHRYRSVSLHKPTQVSSVQRNTELTAES